MYTVVVLREEVGGVASMCLLIRILQLYILFGNGHLVAQRCTGLGFKSQIRLCFKYRFASMVELYGTSTIA